MTKKTTEIGMGEGIVLALAGCVWVALLFYNSRLHDEWGKTIVTHVIGLVISSVACFCIWILPLIALRRAPKLLRLTRIFLWASPVLMCWSCDARFL